MGGRTPLPHNQAIPSLAAKLRQRWESGEPPTIDEVVAELALHSASDCADAIREDQCLRWKTGERSLIEVYLRHAPQVAADASVLVDVILDEVILRREYGETLELGEYVARFPHMEERLRRQFAVDAVLESEGASAENGGSAAMLPEIPGYELIEQIGRGGMGVVFKVRQINVDRIVALKTILAGEFADEREVQRFQNEAHAAAKLLHPNIVAIHDVGEHRSRHYFTMDFVDGPTLAALVSNGPLEPETAAEYVRKIATAIDYAHNNGILHRDLKPKNILIDSHGEPRVADFGLAKWTDRDGSLTSTGAILGTPQYLAPEQVSAKSAPVTQRTDVYALGAILYELLTGRPPFASNDAFEIIRQVKDVEPKPPRLLNPSVPVDLNSICLKCLSKEPQHRYATAQVLAEDLGRYLRGEPVRARPIGMWNRFWRSCRRRPALFTAVALAAMLVATVATLATYPESSSPAAIEMNRFPNLRFRDGFEDQGRSGKLWFFREPRISKVPRQAAVGVQHGSLRLKNRGYLVTAEEFPLGMAIEFDWKWTEGDGTYCDDLTVCVRTSGQPGDWSHEATDGVALRFSPEEGHILLKNLESPKEIDWARGLKMTRNQWHRIRVEDDGSKIVVFFNDLTTPVLTANVDSHPSGPRLAIYNREPVGGVDKVSLIDNVTVWVPAK